MRRGRRRRRLLLLRLRRRGCFLCSSSPTSLLTSSTIHDDVADANEKDVADMMSEDSPTGVSFSQFGKKKETNGKREAKV